MYKCEKCGTNLNDDCAVVWKCSECGKAFKVSFSKLHKIQEVKKQKLGQHLIKCSSCGNILDDGNEEIVCKCSSCGNVLRGNLAYFVSDDNINNAEINLGNSYPDLIECPECGKKILSDSRICSYCGYPLEMQASAGCAKRKKSIKEFCKMPKFILVVVAVLLAVIILSFIIKNFAKCEHEYDNGIITKWPTCTEEGEKTYTCTLCEETKSESLPVVSHTYKEKITKEPTFEEEGEKTIKCEKCGNSYTESIPMRDDEVMVDVTNKTNIPMDLDAGRYSDRVDLTFAVTNRTDKAIKGVQGELIVCDLFGEKILTIECDFVGNTIPVGGSIFVNDLGIDINQFMNSHIKFYNTDFSDLKFEYKIVNIVYDDGSSMIEDMPKESMESKKVTVYVTDKKNLDINYNVGRYSPRVEFTFKVYNNTSKSIKGVQGILGIKDLFGVDIMSSSLDFTGQIIGANDDIVVSGMGIDINQFKDDHVKIYNTNFDDLKFEYEVTSIIYEDGKTE